jgi:hypothetical protein
MLGRDIAVTAGFAFTLMLGLAGSAGAVIAWDEAVNGEFSHNGFTPTVVNLIVGDNDMFGTYGRTVAGGPVNPDYFTFTVPAGEALTAITVLPGTTSAGPLNDSFIGLEAGKQLTLPTTVTTAAGLLGWFHFGPEDIYANILPEMGVAMQGSSGFTPPLGPGDYAVWVQETGVCAPNLCTYGLEFTLVPEPASSAALLIGLGILGVVRKFGRRKSRQLAGQV